MDFEKELSDLYPWILRVARRYYYSIQDAEDLASDTVYKMLVNRDKFDRNRNMKPWCLIVMQNTYITQYHRKSLIPFVNYPDVIERYSSFDVLSHSILQDMLSIIQRCARKSCCIESVTYYAEGYSYDEISDILNIPVGTVRSRISFGRKILFRAFNM